MNKPNRFEIALTDQQKRGLGLAANLTSHKDTATSDRAKARICPILRCDIHELLESRLQDKETNLVEIAAKVTEVLADLILWLLLMINRS